MPRWRRRMLRRQRLSSPDYVVFSLEGSINGFHYKIYAVSTYIQWYNWHLTLHGYGSYCSRHRTESEAHMHSNKLQLVANIIDS